MRVLILCESSGVTRRAFQDKGAFAVSVDLLPAQDEVTTIGDSGGHHQGDMWGFLGVFPASMWDLIIAHPDCTYLTTAAEWCYKPVELQTKKLNPDKLYGAARQVARVAAVEFVRQIMKLDCPRIAIENPIGNVLGTRIDATEYGFSTVKATQRIQPYEYGDDASKGTGLWLKGLPPLVPDPTKRVPGRLVTNPVTGKTVERWSNQTDSGQNNLGPSNDRWKERANTYKGWSEAMAEQWFIYKEAS